MPRQFSPQVFHHPVRKNAHCAAKSFPHPQAMKTALILSACAFCASASADILFQQPPYTSEVFGLHSASDAQMAADDFTPTSDILVNSVTWHGTFSENYNAPDRLFSVRFYNAVQGAPWTVIYQTELIP